MAQDDDLIKKEGAGCSATKMSDIEGSNIFKFIFMIIFCFS